MLLEPQLQITDLSFARAQTFLFKNLNFSVNAGEILLITGSNGSGKSTLLRLLIGLTQEDSGFIKWKGKKIQAILKQYRHDLHYVAHQNGIKLGLTIAENLQIMMHLNNHSISEQYEIILQELDLLTYRNTLAGHLSAGQKRRLSLARLFFIPKPLWILDEPLTALDNKAQHFFLQQLENHLDHQGIAIISSHHSLTLGSRPIQKLELQSC